MRGRITSLAARAPLALVWGLLALPFPGPAWAAQGSASQQAAADLPTFRSDAWYLPAQHLLGFVEIPAGPVLMGSDPARDSVAFDNERWSAQQPQGTVEVDAFYIGRYEVTVAQFRTFVESTGYGVDERSLQSAPDHPVVAVSWTDALAYARWLEATLRVSPSTPTELKQLLNEGWRISVPSEAEWERAARGADGRIYPWGDEPRADRATFAAQGTTPVGSYDCPECPFGLSDMAGNAWEWTRSPYQPYPYDEGDDRSNLEVDALWVMRGGSFGDAATLVRNASRGAGAPGVRRPFIGFRLAITRF